MATVKFTITIDEGDLQDARATAKDLGTSLSGFASQCIKEGTWRAAAKRAQPWTEDEKLQHAETLVAAHAEMDRQQRAREGNSDAA